MQGTENAGNRVIHRVVRILQVTDCHLGPGADYHLAGIRTLNSFDEVLRRISGDPLAPDMLMVTGDIAAHGSPRAYINFTGRMAATGLPYAWLPGNHDDFGLMTQSVGAPPYKPLLALGNWRILSLNTAVPNRVEGRLAQTELDFVEQTLSAEADHPVAIFMHHPPRDVGCRWLDRQQVANGSELAGILALHSNVKAIFTGHVHQQSALEFAGIPLFTTPSTCFQFAAMSDDFALAELPPGYRWIDLHEDGSFDTGVEFLANSAEKVDTGVHGY